MVWTAQEEPVVSRIDPGRLSLPESQSWQATKLQRMQTFMGRHEKSAALTAEPPGDGPSRTHMLGKLYARVTARYWTYPSVIDDVESLWWLWRGSWES